VAFCRGAAITRLMRAPWYFDDSRSVVGDEMLFLSGGKLVPV